MSYCLPKKYTSLFLRSLADGTIDIGELSTRSSGERNNLFSNLFGEENAKEVNALFESKLLLKNQIAGMMDWVRSVGGLKPEIQNDIVDKIQKLSRVLQPADEHSFLADLANKKLGIEVTPQEAQQLFDASTKVKQLDEVRRADWDNLDNRRAYGLAKQDLIDLMNSMKPNGMTFKEGVVQALGIPKQILTGEFHFTAPIQQNWGLMTTKQWAKGIPEMWGYFSSEDNYRNLMADIISHPDYELAKDGELGLTDLGDKFTAREEENISRIMEKLNQHLKDNTGIPNLFRASSRGFTGFSNYVRFYRFMDLVNAAKLTGEDVSKGSQVLKDLAAAVNDFSGRGKILGERVGSGSLSAALNLLFFAPKKLSGTINMFNPVKLTGIDMGDARLISPTARNARVRQLSGSLLATGALLSLAASFGYKVNMNPVAQGFAEVETPGGQKFDVTGGNAIYLRLLSRLVMNKEVTSRGKEIDFGEGYNPQTRAGAIADFLRGKLSPFAGFVTDALYGSDPAHRPFALTQEFKDKFVPIVADQFLDYYMNNPKDSADILPSLLSIGGITMRSPQPVNSKLGVSVWGEPSSVFHPAQKNDIDREFDRLGYTPPVPPQTINGVKISDEQYKKYIASSGQDAKSMIEPMIENPDWSKMPDKDKLVVLKSMIQASRTKAATQLQAESMGQKDGLMFQIIKKWMDQGEDNTDVLKEEAVDKKPTLPSGKEHSTEEQKQEFKTLEKLFDKTTETGGSPISKLGALTSDTDTIKHWGKNYNVLGETFDSNIKSGDLYKDDPKEKELFDQMGITPETAKGHVGIGPDAIQDPTGRTIHHELGHKGLNYIAEHSGVGFALGHNLNEILVRLMGAESGSKETQENDKAWLDERYNGGYKKALERFKPILDKYNKEALKYVKQMIKK